MTESKNEKQRRRLAPDQKIAILKAHLVDQKPISDLCDQPGIQPGQFYRWQQEFFERGRLVFEIISDNGPPFIARDFKEFIRICGMTHVRTSPFYAQSNGKIERWHQSLKQESIRPRCPLSLADAREIVTGYVEHYNTRRLHSAIGYLAPADKLAGREREIFAARDRKLEAARQQRQVKRQADRAALWPEDKSCLTNQAPPETVRPSRETEAGSAEEQPAEG